MQEVLEYKFSFPHFGVFCRGDSSTPGSHPLVVQFLKGVRQLRTVSKPMASTWDLELVLDDLLKPPFGPLESVDLRVLSYKTALLVALVTTKRVGVFHTLSVHHSCVELVPGDSKVKVTF